MYESDSCILQFLADIKDAFIEKQETINTQDDQTMANIKDALAKFTFTLSFQEKGKFPSQPQQNPKGNHSVSATMRITTTCSLNAPILKRSGGMFVTDATFQE